MFQKKQYKSASHFSIMLSEELLRAELKLIYGVDIKIFRLDVTASPFNESIFAPGGRLDRTVKLLAIIGPFEKTYEPSFEGDNRRNLRRVEAECVLYSVENGAIWWLPQSLHLLCGDSYGRQDKSFSFTYAAPGLPTFEVRENPCADMCASQTPANYPYLHRLTDIS
jgi:hypothetical protein